MFLFREILVFQEPVESLGPIVCVYCCMVHTIPVRSCPSLQGGTINVMTCTVNDMWPPQNFTQVLIPWIRGGLLIPLMSKFAIITPCLFYRSIGQIAIPCMSIIPQTSCSVDSQGVLHVHSLWTVLWTPYILTHTHCYPKCLSYVDSRLYYSIVSAHIHFYIWVLLTDESREGSIPSTHT